MTCLTVRMLSDWSVGSGRGIYASTDSVVARDADGLPFLPAKTVTGLWRDAAEALALALDEGASGPWHAWLRWVFGDQPAAGQATGASGPRPAALSVRAARYPEVLRAHLRGRPLLLDAVTVVRPAVAIDPLTGAAAEGMLRLEERARAGAVLVADIEIDLAHAERWPAALLLLGGAALIDHIGGRRRRGAGRSQWELELEGWDLGALCDQAAAGPVIPVPPAALPIPAGHVAEDLAEPLDPARRWATTRFRIRALSPVLVGVTTRGNSAVSADHVPGATLLPIIAAALPNTRELLARNELFVSDAAIVLEGRRALPVPRLLQRLRDEPEADLRSAFVPSDRPGKVVTLSGWVAPALSWTDGTVLIGQPEMTTQSHAVIDDALQRPTAQSGGLFMNTALAEGSLLEFEVTVPEGTGLDLSSVVGRRRLGRSAKDDYGHVEIEVASHEEPSLPDLAEHPSEMVVWLLSDLALPSEQDQPGGVEAAVRAEIAHALDAVVEVPDDGRPTAFLGVVRRETWQANWGLPRPSLLLVTKGSCLRVALSRPATAQQRWELEHLGVGARRGEGLGRLALLPSDHFPTRERASARATVPPLPDEAECLHVAAHWDCAAHLTQVAMSAAGSALDASAAAEPTSAAAQALAVGRPWLTDQDVHDLMSARQEQKRPRAARRQGEANGS